MDTNFRVFINYGLFNMLSQTKRQDCFIFYQSERLTRIVRG